MEEQPVAAVVNNQFHNPTVPELTEDSERAKQPKGFDKSVKLMPHQLATLQAAVKLESEGFIQLIDEADTHKSIQIFTKVGVLGDIPGYGKTLTACAIMLANPEHDSRLNATGYEMVSHVNEYSTIMEIRSTPYKQSPINLVIVPFKIATQWATELNKTNLRWEKYHRGKKNPFNHDLSNGDDLDVVLIPSSMAKDFFKQYPVDEYCWNRVFIDEADSIAIPNFPSLHFNWMWLITASFEQMSEYHRLRKGFLARAFRKHEGLPPYYLRQVVKCTEEFARMSFALPPPTNKVVRCREATVHRVVHGLIDAETQEMLHAGDYAAVVERLGGKVGDDEDIIKLVRTKFEKEIGDLKARIEYNNLLNISDAEKETRNKKVQERIDAIEERLDKLTTNIKNLTETDCSICYCPVEKAAMMPCCYHIFCRDCIFQWFGSGRSVKSCPNCRAESGYDKVIIVTEDGEEVGKGKAKAKEPSPAKKEKPLKEDAVAALVKKHRDHILVFSAHAFDRIGEALNKRDIKWGVMAGTGAHVNKMMREFESGETPVIMMNAHNNGAGMNIPTAKVIIIVHKMAEPLERQLIGRANRMGRQDKNPVIVYRLKHPNE